MGGRREQRTWLSSVYDWSTHAVGLVFALIWTVPAPRETFVCPRLTSASRASSKSVLPRRGELTRPAPIPGIHLPPLGLVHWHLCMYTFGAGVSRCISRWAPYLDPVKVCMPANRLSPPKPSHGASLQTNYRHRGDIDQPAEAISTSDSVCTPCRCCSWPRSRTNRPESANCAVDSFA